MAKKPQGEGPIEDDGTLFDYYKRRKEQREARPPREETPRPKRFDAKDLRDRDASD